MATSLAEAVEAAWVCGRCGSIAGDMPRCWDCGAQLIPGDLPVLRYKAAPIVAVLVTLGVVGVVVALGWAVSNGQNGQSSAAAPATIHPSFVSAAPTEPAATPDVGAEQAKAVNALLVRSKDARSRLAKALDAVRSCDSAAVNDMSDITAARSRQWTDARNLDVDALAQGEDLKAYLVEALRLSFEADASFQRAAEAFVSQSCRIPITSFVDYDSGTTFSDSATEQKKLFVELWNPVAADYGLPDRKWGDI